MTARYVLGHSEGEVERLIAQARFIEPITRRWFIEAGIGPGMRVLDVGCGVGDVSFLAAELVGSAGEVVGIDAASAAIAVARRRAQTRGVSNVSFEERNLSELVFEPGFDAVVGRYVLMYLSDLSAVLSQLAAFLRPGGVIAFHELDLAGYQSYPEAPQYDRCCRWVTELFHRSGDDGRMGIKLHQAFVDAGLPPPAMRSEALLGGDATGREQVDQLAAGCVAWASALERLGIATAEEIGADTLAERLHEEMTALGSVIARQPEIGAWARIA